MRRSGSQSYPLTIACAAGMAALAPAYVVRWRIGFYPTTPLEIAELITLAVFAAESARRRAWPRWRTPVTAPALVLVLAGAISVLTAPSASAALGVYRAYFIEPALVGLALFNAVRTARQAYVIALGLCAGALVLAVANSALVLDKVVHHTYSPNPAPPSAIYPVANMIALYIVPVIALAVALAVHARERWVRFAFGLFAVIAVPSAVLVFSRGGWLALLAVAVGVALSMRRRWLWLGALALVLAGSMLVPVIRQHIVADFTPGPSENLDGRTALWSASLKMLAGRPLFGAGLSGFMQRMTAADPSYHVTLMYPHDIVLNFWSETGLLGLFSFAAIVTITTVIAWRGWRSGPPEWRPVQLGVLLAMVAMLVHGLVDVPYFKNDLSVQFWILVGLAVAGRAVAPRERPREDQLIVYE